MDLGALPLGIFERSAGQWPQGWPFYILKQVFTGPSDPPHRILRSMSSSAIARSTPRPRRTWLRRRASIQRSTIRTAPRPSPCARFTRACRQNGCVVMCCHREGCRQRRLEPKRLGEGCPISALGTTEELQRPGLRVDPVRQPLGQARPCTYSSTRPHSDEDLVFLAGLKTGMVCPHSRSAPPHPRHADCDRGLIRRSTPSGYRTRYIHTHQGVTILIPE